MKTKQILFALLATLALIWAGCDSDDETTGKYVDLRYLADDEYVLDAVNPAPVTIVVKSSDPWEVTGATGGWYTISPTSGAADERVTVTITPAGDNTGLDDFTDTITIASAGWVGKQFVIIQKGTAYLDLLAEPELIGKTAGATTTITLASNQNWSAKVTEGGDWLSLQGSAQGTGDATITLEAGSANLDEVPRTGYVTIYDRHDVAKHKILITQKGLYLLYLTDNRDVTTFTIPETEVELLLNVTADEPWEARVDANSALWLSATPVGQTQLKITSSSNFKAWTGGKVTLRPVSMPDVDGLTLTVNQNSAGYTGGNAIPPWVTQDPDTGWLTLTGDRPDNGGYFPIAGFAYHQTGVFTWNIESIYYPYTTGTLQTRMRHINPYSGSGEAPAYYFTWEPNNNGRLRISGSNIPDYYPPAYSTWATSGQIRQLQVRLSGGTTETVAKFYVDGGLIATYDFPGRNPNDYRTNMDFTVFTTTGYPNYEIILKSMTWEPLE